MSEIKQSVSGMTNPAGIRKKEQMVPQGNNTDVNSAVNICSILRRRPHAVAAVRGSSQYPRIRGRVMFYQMRMGVLVAAEIFGLPPTKWASIGSMPQAMNGNMQQSIPGTEAQLMPGQSRSTMPDGMSQNMPGNMQQSTHRDTTQLRMSEFDSSMMSSRCNSPVFGFHIHGGSSCGGNAEDPFADAGEHYNPAGCEHPYHAGDMPPLFGNNGYAFQVFLTDRFNVHEILGKTVIIHANPDDFMTQPGGNAGSRIACGKISEGETGIIR